MTPLLTSQRDALLAQYRSIHQSIKCDASEKAAVAILQVVNNDVVSTS
jgi:lipid-A-disaccharide synthase